MSANECTENYGEHYLVRDILLWKCIHQKFKSKTSIIFIDVPLLEDSSIFAKKWQQNYNVMTVKYTGRIWVNIIYHLSLKLKSLPLIRNISSDGS